MKNLFEFAEAFFCQVNADKKLALTHQAWQTCIAGELTLTSDRPVLPIERVTFPEKPELLAPRQMSRRKLTTPDGIAAFFHAFVSVKKEANASQGSNPPRSYYQAGL